MTLDEVRERVAEIFDIVHDDEMAHRAEDALHRDVLRAIASGAENAQELAQAALVTEGFDFARWCA